MYAKVKDLAGTITMASGVTVKPADLSLTFESTFEHCKKRLAIFLSPAGMSLTKLYQPGCH
jgi:hypothetical protein